MRELVYKIRKLRELQECSSEQMADHLGITPRMYRKIEAGQAGLSVERLCQIAERLRCRAGDLLHERLDDLRVRHLNGDVTGMVNFVIPNGFPASLPH